MHLLHTETLTLHEFTGDDIPPYAILSHRWASAAEETTFRDVRKQRVRRETSGYRKVQNACRVAKHNYGMSYIWIDTCCINKESSAELSEAINSMFMWYQNALICLAFLSDVAPCIDSEDATQAFMQSEWFTRAWTLQELIAPRHLEFFNNVWNSIGTKADHIELIEKITSISPLALQDSDSLWTFNVVEKMGWASNREATRTEDIAYSLLGIFDVSIPLLYGEGDKAFIRLQEEIIRQANNILFLSWGMDELTPQLLAHSPSSFETDLALESHVGIQPFNWTNIGLQIETKVLRLGLDVYGIILARNSREFDILIILRKEPLINNTYFKVCITSMHINAKFWSSTQNITIMRGTRDQRIGQGDTEYTPYNLVVLEPYVVEFCCDGDIGFRPDGRNDNFNEGSCPPSWTTIEETYSYEAKFKHPGWWSVAGLTCMFDVTDQFQFSFAFDFDWHVCLLIERLPYHKQQHKMWVESSLKMISEKFPEMNPVASRTDDNELVEWQKIEAREDRSMYFLRMRRFNFQWAPLPDGFLSPGREVRFSFNGRETNKWSLKISGTATVPPSSTKHPLKAASLQYGRNMKLHLAPGSGQATG